MTPTEAVALAVVGSRDRRLLAAILRATMGRSTVEDQEALPAREADEPVVQWACRCRANRRDPGAWVVELGRVEEAAAAQLTVAARLGIASIPLFDARYPPLVASIPDPPPNIWIKGEPCVLHQPAVAIVGSRAATPYGLAMAARISMDLAAAGLVIVSGLARGVDSAAHAAALSARGRTIGVLGCGLDRIYPAEHKDLARTMEDAGAIVSEFPPGVPPLPHHFPLRNRLISGLSRVVVIVEASEKSGALITASAALEQGRDVMVVPGNATGGRNRGGHLLIRDGAKVVESADDILEEMAAMPCVPEGQDFSRVGGQDLSPAMGPAGGRDFSGAGGRDFSLARGPAAGPPTAELPETIDFTVDDVAHRTGEQPNVVLARLLKLELSGRIRRVGGGRFVRVLT